MSNWNWPKPNNQLTEAETLAVLQAIDRGEVTLNPEDVAAASDNYCGVEHFRCSNGWEFWIFNDCDQWDYIELAQAPDGRNVEFGFLANNWPSVYAFAPKPGVWGIDH